MLNTKWMARSRQYSIRKASSRPEAAPSKARTSGCCVPAGAFPPSKSTAWTRIRCAGPTVASRFRALQPSLASPQTVFDYLARGLLAGRQLAKGQPWQIELSDEQISRLRNRVRRTKRSKKEASRCHRLADDIVPMFDRNLAGDDGRGATVAIIEDLQKVAPFWRIEH